MRKLLAVFICAASLMGCSSTPYVGISIHDNSIDGPEYYSENPIGLFGVEMSLAPSTVLFVEHQSSIPYREDGYGLNHLGLKYKFTTQ